MIVTWVKVFKNGPSKILWKTVFKKFEADHITLNFLKAVFQQFYLVDSWIAWTVRWLSLITLYIIVKPFQTDVLFLSSVKK